MLARTLSTDLRTLQAAARPVANQLAPGGKPKEGASRHRSRHEASNRPAVLGDVTCSPVWTRVSSSVSAATSRATSQPVLIHEWRLEPTVWNRVGRAVRADEFRTRQGESHVPRGQEID